MTKLPATRGDVYAIVVSAYEDEYKDLAEAWRALETKAQGAAAIGGVFLAAGATLSKTLLTGVPRWAAVTFAASFALLIAAIGFAVRALRVTITARRPEGAENSPIGRARVESSRTGIGRRGCQAIERSAGLLEGDELGACHRSKEKGNGRRNGSDPSILGSPDFCDVRRCDDSSLLLR